MKKILIVYYSRKGQNYWAGSIKNLPKGNTAVAAEFIQQATGGDIFEIDTVNPYPEDYTACINQAKAELRSKARPEIKKYLDFACQAADQIGKDALDAPLGGKFWKLLDLSMIDFPKETTFPNWSHGTTGTAWMFAALYQDTKREDYLQFAKQGLEYAMNISVGDETGRLIPYQDHPVTGPTYDKYYLSTCHGPVGSTLAFRVVYEATGEDLFRKWTEELSRGIVKAGAPEKHSWGYWNCRCQCCGTAGILEHFAAMYEFTGEQEFYDYMIRTADVMLADSDHRTPGKKAWYDSWWRTIPTRIVSYPGLYVGAAGCGSSLLKTYAVMTGKKLTNLYEYHFFEK